PVLGVGVRLNAIASYVKPDGGVESRVLANQDVSEFVVESSAVFGRTEIALGQSPVANGFSDAGDELANPGLALRSAKRTVKVLAGHDVSGGHRPVFGDFDVFLFEDDVAVCIGDGGGAQFPFDLVIGADAGLGEEATEGEPWGSLLISSGGGARGGTSRHRSG